MSIPPIDSDWHLHTCHSCDCKGGAIPTSMRETVAAVAEAGVRDFGITDHLHTPFNLPDIEASRHAFDALPDDPRRHFGIEVSCVSAWELDEIARGGHANPVYGLRAGGPAGGPLAIGVDAGQLARLRVEYVVGGTHWPLYVPLEREAVIRDYHRQNMFLACHPLVNIVAHPWWWMGHWREADGMYRTAPWFDDFGAVPRSMHDEFAAAVRERGKAVEINLNAMVLARNYPDSFKRQYGEYLAALQAAGVALSIGSDHHAQHHRYADYEGGGSGPERGPRRALDVAAAVLAGAGVRLSALWRLPPRPVAPGRDGGGIEARPDRGGVR